MQLRKSISLPFHHYQLLRDLAALNNEPLASLVGRVLEQLSVEKGVAMLTPEKGKEVAVEAKRASELSRKEARAKNRKYHADYSGEPLTQPPEPPTEPELTTEPAPATPPPLSYEEQRDDDGTEEEEDDADAREAYAYELALRDETLAKAKLEVANLRKLSKEAASYTTTEEDSSGQSFVHSQHFTF